MAESWRDDETGTTLSELLVVMLLLGFVGAVTTTGIVQGFNAQLTSTNVAETLDGTRIATQRVRDFVRGASEVCSESTPSQLVLWTDDDNDGEVVEAELDIFELVTDGGDEVFQRRVPVTGDEEVQLIRDDIINAAVFAYDVDPKQQPKDLNCQRDTEAEGGPSRTRSVSVTFQVANPDPAEPDLVTATTVQVRNASLQVIAGTTPTAAFTIKCPAGTEQCAFDGSTSSDPDGLVIDWLWDFGDGTTGTGATVTHTYSEGNPEEYSVRLTVRDNDGFSNSLQQTARPGVTDGNGVPLAQILYSCTGLQCTFDGSGSTDTDGSIVNYDWDYGDGTTDTGPTPTTHTYSTACTPCTVALTVTDDGGAANTASVSVEAANNVLRVEGLDAAGSAVSGSGNNKTWKATVTIRLSLTTGGSVADGVNISAGATGGTGANSVKRTGSCATDGGDGGCVIEFSGLSPQVDPLQVTVAQVNDPSGNYVYDDDQNLATCIVVSPASTSTAPPDCEA